MNVLVTGGAGYIGSHTVVKLLECGDTVIIVDNLSNAHPNVLERIERITGKTPVFYAYDVRDETSLDEVFDAHQPDAVIHFAGLKAVGDSVAEPLRYYRENVGSTMALLSVMQNHKVKNLVFSSSATVYGAGPSPYKEEYPTGQGITSPYGKTKYMIEEILRDLAASDNAWQIYALRYFNPVGAHPSGLIGEQPSGAPNNLMPYITQVAQGIRPELQVFGNDYPTPDGTGVRDYVHVDDIADGHIRAIERLRSGFTALNLGSGRGTSVLELVHAFEKMNRVPVPYSVMPRRAGDLPSYYAVADKAAEFLGWRPIRTVEDMVEDSWRWQSKNPDGYDS